MKSSLKKKFLYSFFLIALILTVLYLLISVFFQYHFERGTVINGIDCSYKSVSQTEDIFKDAVRYYYLEIIGRNDYNQRISASEIDMAISFNDDFKNILDEQNNYL